MVTASDTANENLYDNGTNPITLTFSQSVTMPSFWFAFFGAGSYSGTFSAYTNAADTTPVTSFNFGPSSFAAETWQEVTAFGTTPLQKVTFSRSPVLATRRLHDQRRPRAVRDRAGRGRRPAAAPSPATHDTLRRPRARPRVFESFPSSIFDSRRRKPARGEASGRPLGYVSYGFGICHARSRVPLSLPLSPEVTTPAGPSRRIISRVRIIGFRSMPARGECEAASG